MDIDNNRFVLSFSSNYAGELGVITLSREICSLLKVFIIDHIKCATSAV